MQTGIELAMPHRDVERQHQDLARLRRVDDRVDPEPRGRVADVGLAIVPPTKLLGHGRELGVVDLLFPGV